ncbi:MAG: alanine--tRNA ligase, partial [Nitrospirales bacterium]
MLEIWNLVFMQFNKNDQGTPLDLPKKNIDTGMGLERLAAIVQGKTSNYDTDLFQPILRAIEESSNTPYGRSQDHDRAMRVIADHLRAIAFMIADGILPSNEGRGYVLRRILRRAGRYGRVLGLGHEGPFLGGLSGTVVELMEPAYPDLGAARETVRTVTEAEEERFLDTLERGEPMLAAAIAEARTAKRKSISGDKLFELYDTYGYPLNLAADSARDQGLTLDMAGFEAALERQRERARKGAGFEMEKTRPVVADLAGRLAPTQFLGYDRLTTESVLQAILKGDRLVREAVEGDAVELVLDVTPFYAEGGGQVGDSGTLVGPEGRVEIQDTIRPAPTLIVHKGVVRVGRIREGERVQGAVNPRSRQDAARNHTATHLANAALREILGSHVKQYGSLVAPNRLRFDFAHFRPLSSRDVEDIEALVNEQVQRNAVVQTEDLPVQDAIAAGALAFFGDKYGDRVRVVTIDTFSKELCGGTHCRQTGEIGLFRLVGESGVAAGVRRIECLTGFGAMAHIQQLEREIRELTELLKVGPSDLVGKTKKLMAQLKEKERELERVKLQMASGASTDADVRSIQGIQVHVQRADGLEMSELRALADRVRDKLKSGVIALGSAKDGKVSLLIAVTKDLTGRLRAGDLIREVAAEVGGSGGGRPELAQAGGKQPERLSPALDKV